VTDGIVAGQPVHKGQVIATLGHSSDTREGIPSERAHLHFEINFMLNSNFHIWYPRHEPKAPPFGDYNGLNLFGTDPAAILRAYAANPKLNFAEYIAREPVAFTVLVGARPFPWLALHPEQVQLSSAASRADVVAYEVGVTWYGLPVAVWPRSDAEISESARRVLQRALPVLQRVDEAALERSPCRDLVKRGRHGWQLAQDGQEWVQILTYAP
jgi:hypothetical protein